MVKMGREEPVASMDASGEGSGLVCNAAALG